MSLSKLPTLKSLASSLWNVLVPDVDALEERRDARLRASSNLVIPIEPGLYDALELTGSQIRLVILKPLLRGPPWVTCDLIKTYDGFGQLSCPEYYALSYTWRYIGHDIETKSILINGREVVIGTNLWYALYQLSPKTGSLKIWIDALCINQKNVEERNSQVMQMGRIYSEAKRVIVWLGQEDAQTRQAIKCIEYLANPQPCRTSEDPSSHVAIIAATLTHFFDRQYWRRVWIVQEVILAKSITIYSGACMLEWDTFVEACHHPGDYGISEEMADICLGLIQQSTPAHFERLRADPDKGRTLMGLLHASQENNATDTRDMVYGLLGIANDSGFLEVDYDKSPVQLWHDLLLKQSEPPEGVDSATFSGDKRMTVYFAQFMWDVLKLEEEDLDKLLLQRERIKVRGMWTDSVIQLGPGGSDIIAARRATRDSTRYHEYKDWREELIIEGPRDWDLSVLQSVQLPTSHRGTKPVFATTTSSSDSASISIDVIQYPLPEGQIRPKGTTNWTLHRPAKLARKRTYRNFLRESILPLGHESPWDTYQFIITETGQIGWTTPDVKQGDLICRFQDTDISLLLRPKSTNISTKQKLKFDIVGRIMLLRRSGEKAGSRVGSRKAFRHSVPGEEEMGNGVEVKLSIGVMTMARLSYCLRPKEREPMILVKDSSK